ncbi:MAG: MBOAT family protein [Firmicutes bacterium]|nr:MBOAT family protein [Bacillota bacterium]
MSFTSQNFLFFLTVIFAVYYLVPHKFRWALLLIGSLFFYACSGFILYILATIITTYIAGILLEKKRSRLVVTAWFIINAGWLLMVKIPSFGLLMPLGISFYTFQSASYILDLYRKKTQIERNPLKLALFVSFFPQIIQGPISRHNDLAQTLFNPQEFSIANISYGMRRILWGFFKKLVIADRLLPAIKLMSASTETFTGGYAALNVLLYAVVLYADFTGGIDITIGIARFFGVRVSENFNKPFYSANIAEYWRRWHITMGTWFRDYLFYPLSVCRPMRRFSKISRHYLGNNFGKRLPVYITTIVTWFATGLWHGATANFIAWGLANGLVIILSQECEPLYKHFHTKFTFSNSRYYHGFAIVRTFLLMCAIRSFDIYAGVGTTLHMLFSMFRPWHAVIIDIGLPMQNWLVAALGVMLLIIAGHEEPRRRFESLNPVAKLSLCLLFLCVIIVFGVYGYGYDANQFIYNRF